jgi:hypothetical protein
MVMRVQTLRSSVKLQRPGAGTREPGELFANFADLQLGMIDAGKNAVDLIAVRFFSAATDYVAGNFVLQGGTIYRAKAGITAGAFNAANWDAVSTAADLAGKENAIAAGSTAQYWRGDKSWQTLDKSAVGLANVDNTSDANKPVSTAGAAADNARVLKAGDTMSGHLVLPTGPGSTNAVRKDYVDAAIPTWSSLTGKPATFPPTLPIAESDVTNLVTDLAAKAPLASPTFTGDPKAPTPTAGDNDTSVATTAFVVAAITAALAAAGSVPVGACIDFPATAAPTGYLKRNGALVSRTTYAALWTFAQASGNLVANDGAWTGNEGAFSPGDGSTTFRLPDDRGEFIRGYDDARGVDAGRVIGASQGGLAQAHNHDTLTVTALTGGTTAGLLRTAAGPSVGAAFWNVNNSTGAETRPRNHALLRCIKY